MSDNFWTVFKTKILQFLSEVKSTVAVKSETHTHNLHQYVTCQQCLCFSLAI